MHLGISRFCPVQGSCVCVCSCLASLACFYANQLPVPCSLVCLGCMWPEKHSLVTTGIASALGQGFSLLQKVWESTCRVFFSQGAPPLILCACYNFLGCPLCKCVPAQVSMAACTFYLPLLHYPRLWVCVGHFLAPSLPSSVLWVEDWGSLILLIQGGSIPKSGAILVAFPHVPWP